MGLRAPQRMLRPHRRAARIVRLSLRRIDRTARRIGPRRWTVRAMGRAIARRRWIVQTGKTGLIGQTARDTGLGLTIGRASRADRRRAGLPKARGAIGRKVSTARR